MQVDALLCDAATVRENLLHVLGGGITRFRPESFPAPLGLSLAMIFTLAPSEARERHRLRVAIQTEDGKPLEGGELAVEFQFSPGKDLRPGERLAIPVVVKLDVQIPGEGTYSIDLLLDGQLQRSFTFLATTAK